MPHRDFLLRLLIVWILIPLTSSFADQRTVNWTGPYTACNQRAELLKHDAMDLGVKFSTSNSELEQEFRQALRFWADVLDMTWHEDDTSSCSIQLVDGTPEILRHTIVARSQFTDWDNFQGWIAFNPKVQLNRTELYLTAVHEIGHMLGLKHNPNAGSVMYYLDLEGQEYLDSADLALLATRHKMRFHTSARIPVVRTEDIARN
jgi:hypothetical protein